jgi:hypothetical protein
MQLAEVCDRTILKSFSEPRTPKSLFWQKPSIKLQSSHFHLEDTFASTLPLSNLTQIFPDWWADRIGVFWLALPVITSRTAQRVYTEDTELLLSVFRL